MDRQHPLAPGLTPGSNVADMTKGMITDFDKTIRLLAQTRKALEKDISALRGECARIREDKAALELDIGKAKEASEISMAATVAEEEKQDALKKNQELRAYLDSAGDAIKELRKKLAEADAEIKRDKARIDILEKDKTQLVKEKDHLGSNLSRMSDMIKEQGLSINELTMKLQAAENDKVTLRKQCEMTKKTMDDIQQSMASVRTRISGRRAR